MYQEINIRGSKPRLEHPIAEAIWQNKYQFKSAQRSFDAGVEDTWARVANALAQAEKPSHRDRNQALFYQAMEDFRLLPAGRILAGSGTDRNVTLSNTFVMQTIPDTVEGVMEVAGQAALTMQMGGGLGYDFSTLRPRALGDAEDTGPDPLAAMDIYDAVCRMVVNGAGRGAMMATMRGDHPDIEAFINAKSDPARLRNFNLSVMVSDAFMHALRADAPWELQWKGQVIKRLRARALWNKIMRRTYEAAEPGVLFIDRINALNPLSYIEKISATNSCAEQPLPPNGTCPLTSINLARLVDAPFTNDARLDAGALQHLTSVAVRMLDNTLDVSRFANDAQWIEAQTKRRIGIGVTGVGDALVMLGVRYGTAEAAARLGEWMRIVQNAAYLASAHLAGERGAFATYDPGHHLRQPMIARLDPDTRAALRKHGLRNGTLTSIAPTGTISMFAGNVSSGIEPIFAPSFKRIITAPDGSKHTEEVEDYALWLYRRLYGKDQALPASFVTAMDLTPAEHVTMQAAAQHWVDSGISKTVNCPEDISFEAFQDVYMDAYDSGCKGCTTFRPNAVTGSILIA